jgi:hypothetical protein
MTIERLGHEEDRKLSMGIAYCPSVRDIQLSVSYLET